MSPAAPGTRNAVRQENPTVSWVTTNGVTTAPTAAPELKIPLPRLRSAGGSTRDVTRRAHGQLNASPAPSRARQRIKRPRLGTTAVAIAAIDHQITAAA